MPLDTIRENTRIGAAATDAKYPPPVIPGLVTENKQIPTVDKKTITVRIYTSDELKQKKAPVCILYGSSMIALTESYHGGGFVLGDIDREDGTHLNPHRILTIGSPVQSYLLESTFYCSQCGISSCS